MSDSGNQAAALDGMASALRAAVGVLRMSAIGPRIRPLPRHHCIISIGQGIFGTVGFDFGRSRSGYVVTGRRNRGW